MTKSALEWFTVKCVFTSENTRTDEKYTYEERITLWKTESLDRAVELAETEAQEYIEDSIWEYTGHCMAFHIFNRPKNNREVFSLMRHSDLDVDEYLDRFYCTGKECSQDIEPESQLEILQDYKKRLEESLAQNELSIKRLKKTIKEKSQSIIG